MRPRGRKRRLSQKKWQQVPQKPPQWADGKIIPAGQSRDVQLSSLRKKIREHKNSAAHNEAVKILQTANKDILLNMNASSQESVFESTAKASVDGDMEPIAFPLDLSPKNMRQLSECAHNLDIALRRIGKVFSLRWVASSWRAVSAVWQSYPALAQHFREASEDDTRDSRERAKFKGLLSKLCSINFLKSLALMADVLTELKNLSEILQNRKTTLPKAHDIMTTYVKRIESFNRYPGQHAVDASQAEEVMEFKGEELRVGRSPIIDSAQFIRAVADNMKERLFTTTANRAQASVAANRKEAYNSLINQMAVLNPDNWDHDNPRFGDNEVRALCDVLHVNQQEAHLGFTEYKASGGRNIPNKMKKLLMAVDTLSPSNADCERGFSTMNNIITEYRSKLTTKNAANLLFISSVGPPCRQWDPLPYVKTWLGKGRRAAHSTSCMARRYTEEESYFSPLWKMWKMWKSV
ncbi:E3 SUMO-protein ligase KIAA1586 [Dissostichus eleginoides]|uniref:E3 SUMO-protein ligase KIAA1586 n=1 Tax=Dissostichus eleginoides TaxID=100907 RepID=A0AAD9EXL0_DISEL|nr:E3 SUMO-protein ligase KIAA1586 [Dissostichus eleginoides]